MQVLRRSCSRFGHTSSLLIRVPSAKRTTLGLSDAVNSGLLPCAVQTLSPRFVSVSACLGASEGELEQAKTRVTQLKEDPGNEVKLKLYGLYKQVPRSRLTHTHTHTHQTHTRTHTYKGYFLSLMSKPILQRKGSGDTCLSLYIWEGVED